MAWPAAASTWGSAASAPVTGTAAQACWASSGTCPGSPGPCRRSSASPTRACSRARRARLHARVGEALLRLHGPGDPGHVPELAQHAWAAVPVTGAEAALPHVLAAAGHAIARLAYEQAEQQLRRALGLLGPMPPSAEHTRRELGAQVQLGNLLGQLGSPGAPEAAAVFARAAELAAEVADDPAAVPALAGVHAGSTMRAGHDGARALAERVLHGARRSNGPHALLAGHFLLGHTLCLQGELVAARDHLEAAVRLAAAMPEAALLPGTPLVLSANGLLACRRHEPPRPRPPSAPRSRWPGGRAPSCSRDARPPASAASGPPSIRSSDEFPRE